MKKKAIGLVLLAISLFAGYSLYQGKMVLGIVLLAAVLLIGLIVLGMAEKDNEPSKNVLEIRDNAVYGLITEDGDLNFEETKRVRDEMMKGIKLDDFSLETRKAMDLFLNKDFEGSIRAYEEIMVNYPENVGNCYWHIGVSEFFLGHYETALERYTQAKENDEDHDMTEDNIWEVCEILFKKDGSKQWMERYVNLYPQGRFVKKANKLVS
ncbi:hypothetical protein [Gorillibacterium sp. CAU 1737]|uniref:tetratricopeptide repeat protein n=1 Tax=Gorillibacterium sp. CAU 1737 TaxID=3140362 RepID=UPI0032605BCD